MDISPLHLNAWFWWAWIAYWLLAALFAAKTKQAEGVLLRLAHIVPLYFGFFLIFHDRDYSLIHGRMYHNNGMSYIGNLLTVEGLLFTVWARVHLGKYWSGIITLKEGHRLIRTGPYQIVRHPIYTGILLGALGSALIAATGDAFVGLALMTVTLAMKARREEALLTGEFGDEYRQFRREVRALVPLVY
jgi:protein-S-isoprenylcysteine O-methyltransferase Ste14